MLTKDPLLCMEILMYHVQKAEAPAFVTHSEDILSS